MTTLPTADEWIRLWGLEPHPEGGFYRETYRSPRLLGGRQPVSTAIVFLLRSSDLSAFHRIASDELWHVYAVTAETRLRLWVLTPGRGLSTLVLGHQPQRGEVVQAVVPAGSWFAGQIEVLDGGDPPDAYALVGCTVSPGFLFEDFELADGEALAQEFPAHADLARRLSRRAP